MNIFKEELHTLEQTKQALTKDLQRCTKQKQEAASEGDLRENEAYKTAASNEDRLLKEIHRVEDQIYTLQNFIDRIPKYSGYVSSGSMVKLFYKNLNKTVEGYITPPQIDTNDLFISQDSPVGKSILGKKKGDILTIQVLGVEHTIVVEEVK